MTKYFWTSELVDWLPGMSQTGPHPFLEDLPLELGEHRQQAGHGSAGWRDQVQHLGQRYEAYAEMFPM